MNLLQKWSWSKPTPLRKFAKFPIDINHKVYPIYQKLNSVALGLKGFFPAGTFELSCGNPLLPFKGTFGLWKKKTPNGIYNDNGLLLGWGKKEEPTNSYKGFSPFWSMPKGKLFLRWRCFLIANIRPLLQSFHETNLLKIQPCCLLYSSVKNRRTHLVRVSNTSQNY